MKSEGMESVRRMRDLFPTTTLVADLKTSDTGAIEVEMAAKAGANVVCVLAAADDAVIADALVTRLPGPRSWLRLGYRSSTPMSVSISR